MKRHRSFDDFKLNRTFHSPKSESSPSQKPTENRVMPVKSQESNSRGLRKRAASVEESAQRHRQVDTSPLKSKISSNKVLEFTEYLNQEEEKPPSSRQYYKTSRSPVALERHRTCSVTGQPPIPKRKWTASPLLRALCLLFSGCLLLLMTIVALYLRKNMAAAHSLSFLLICGFLFGMLSFVAVVFALHGCCAANVAISKTSSRTIRCTMVILLVYFVIIYILPFNRQKWYEDTAQQIYHRYMMHRNSSDTVLVDPQDYFLSKFVETGRFRILSYNIFIRPPGVTSNGNDYKDERLVLFLRHMMNYDIICLQELFTLGSDRWQSLVKAARVFGFHYEAHLRRHLFSWLPKIVDGGVTILSKFPIVATDSIFFQRASFSTIDCIVAKGVLYAKIELPYMEPRYLHLFSTHLQAGDEPLEEMWNIKRTQLEQAREFIYSKLNSDKKELVIFCGDLNVNGRTSAVDGRDSKEYLRMMQLLSQSSWKYNSQRISPLKWKDVIRDAYGDMHPVTVGDAEVDAYGQLLRTWELTLASKADRGCRKRLDYILFDPRNSELHVSTNASAKVETFFVSERLSSESSTHAAIFPEKEEEIPKTSQKREKFVQLSDHYGVSASLEL